MTWNLILITWFYDTYVWSWLSIQGQRYSLSQQVLNFETTLNQIRTLMSGRNLTEYLGKSIAVLVFGSNDYINNYLMPSLYSSSFYYSPPDFANLLLNHYTRQLLVLEISDNLVAWLTHTHKYICLVAKGVAFRQ